MWIKFYNFITDYISKEASLADWLAGLGTFLVAVIALWPSISTIFSRLLFPKIKLSIAGKANIVISSDGKIHKFQVPYQFENQGISRGYIEEIQLNINSKMQKFELPWRKFIQDISGSATAPVSNPYRFKIDAKEFLDKFLEFLTEENITLVKAEYEINTVAIVSYGGKPKKIVLKNKLIISQNIIDQIKKNSPLAIKNDRPILISVSLS